MLFQLNEAAGGTSAARVPVHDDEDEEAANAAREAESRADAEAEAQAAEAARRDREQQEKERKKQDAQRRAKAAAAAAEAERIKRKEASAAAAARAEASSPPATAYVLHCNYCTMLTFFSAGRPPTITRNRPRMALRRPVELPQMSAVSNGQFCFVMRDPNELF